MKRAMILAALLSVSQLGYAVNIDRQELAKQCANVAKQLAQLTLVPHQPVKCDLTIMNASGLSYSSGHLINFKRDKMAKRTLTKGINALAKAEENQCLGGGVISISKAELELIKEAF